MDKANGQFGLIVAYLLPGFVGLAGMAPLVPAVGQWLQPVNQGEVGLGPPVYAVLAALALGMILSCLRWFIIDHVMAWTKVVPPKLDYGKLAGRMAAFDYWVEAHYRYYQFYGGTLMGVPAVYLCNRIAGTSPLLGVGTDLGVFILCAVLFAGARDALRKYYQRTVSLTD